MKRESFITEFLAKSSYQLLVLFSFCIPLNKKIIPFIIGTSLLFWLLHLDLKKETRNLMNNKYLLLFISLFLLYCFGIIYSTNLQYGIGDLILKLPLLIFPLIISKFNHLPFDKLKTFFYAYIFGCLIACIICIIHAAYDYSINNSLLAFFYGHLSIFHHPGYFAMYLNFASFILLFFTVFKSNLLNNNLKYISLSLVVFFNIFVIFLSSKTGIGVAVLILLCTVLYHFLIHKNLLRSSLILLSIGTLFYLFQYIISNPINHRFSETKEVIEHKAVAIDTKSTESTEARILVWEASIDILKSNFLFGVGTGDVKDVLLEKYKEKGMTGALEEKLNAHNQFLQTFIALGLPGLLLLMASFVVPFVLAFKSRNFIYMAFLLIVFLNFLTESMLETVSGVFFYAFFNSLLMISINQKELSIYSNDK